MISKFGSALFDKTSYKLHKIIEAQDTVYKNFLDVYLIGRTVFLNKEGNTIPQTPTAFTTRPTLTSQEINIDGNNGTIDLDNNTLVTMNLDIEDKMNVPLFLYPNKIYVPVGAVINVNKTVYWSEKTNLNTVAHTEHNFTLRDNSFYPGYIVFDNPSDPCATYFLEGPDNGQFTFTKTGWVELKDNRPGSSPTTTETILLICYALPQDDDVETGGDL